MSWCDLSEAVLRALVQGSAQRLAALVACLPEQASLPGWQLRVFDGNHLPASHKMPMRESARLRPC